MAANEWADLPSELLELIANRLGLIELLRFRGVCKDWNSASSIASAEIEASPDHEPWFLLYGENNFQYLLVTESDREYAITIPELDGATCLASSQGWLLLFREGSMFFFCPFSRARIDLPGLTLISDDYVALFSSPPTSPDCFVCVISNYEAEEIKLYTIHRGATVWTEYKLDAFATTHKTESAAYHNGYFYFYDNKDWTVYFSMKSKVLGRAKLRYAKSEKEKCLPFRFSTDSEKNYMKKRLALGEDFTLSTCGTRVSRHHVDRLIPYENTGNAKEAGCRPYKGVWFQPRFHQIDQNQSW